MKRISILAIVLLSLACPGKCLATAEGPDFYAVRDVAAGDFLNIRAEPAAKGKIVGRIPPGARRIENRGDYFPPLSSDIAPARWCRIRYEGIEGWAVCRYLIEDADSGAAR